MKLFFAYLRQRWKVLLGAVLFYALFAVSFALYGLRLAAVWYPAALTAVLGLIFFLCDFGRIRRTHAELSALSNVSAEQSARCRRHHGFWTAIIRRSSAACKCRRGSWASSAAAREREASVITPSGRTDQDAHRRDGATLRRRIRRRRGGCWASFRASNSMSKWR